MKPLYSSKLLRAKIALIAVVLAACSAPTPTAVPLPPTTTPAPPAFAYLDGSTLITSNGLRFALDRPRAPVGSAVGIAIPTGETTLALVDLRRESLATFDLAGPLIGDPIWVGERVYVQVVGEGQTELIVIPVGGQPARRTAFPTSAASDSVLVTHMLDATTLILQSGTREAPAARRLDLSSGQSTPYPDDLIPIDFDGGRVLLYDPTVGRLYTAPQSDPSDTTLVFSGPLQQAAFGPDGRIAILYAGRTLLIDGETTYTLTTNATRLAFLRDSLLIAFIDAEGQPRIARHPLVDPTTPTQIFSGEAPTGT